MAIETYNPYKASNTIFTDGLDYIIANLPGSPTFDDLLTTITAYFNSLPDPPGAEIIGLMPSMMANTVNDYVNSKIAENLNFGGNEWAIVDSVLSGIKGGSIESMEDFLEAALQQVAEATISTPTKTTLYGAAGFAKASFSYWGSVVKTPGSWATYINTNEAINWANIPFWVEATYVGTFSGFAQVQAPNIPDANLFNVQGRMGGGTIAISTALALTAGKVIFKWAQRPVIYANCNCH